MLLTRLYLRNFRVYEDELDLELPPGLVGIYGPNGAGKSTLLEAIIWTLWGKARTTKDLVRTSGVGGDCVTELEFEHEGHLYLVRRMLIGVNATQRLEARCDGLVMSQGIRDSERYIESVLGMDDSSFKASVFAEQKQLAAFSDQSPSERLRLVLRLLGITPLDAARDAARKDARTASGDHQRLRSMLPDLGELETLSGDADAKAAAAEARAAQEAAMVATAEEAAQSAGRRVQELDQRRQEYDSLVLEGRAAREELDRISAIVTSHEAELAELREAGERLSGLDEVALGLKQAEVEAAAIASAASASLAAARVVVPPEPEPSDDVRVRDAAITAAETAAKSAAAKALSESASSDLTRARDLSKRSASLTGEADCPLCGQALGEAFAQVQAHRAAELAEAEKRVKSLGAEAVRAAKLADKAIAEHKQLESAAAASRSARAAWEQAAQRRADADSALAESWAAVVAANPSNGSMPGTGELSELAAAARKVVEAKRESSMEAERLRGRLERQPALEESLAASKTAEVASLGRVEVLREKVRAIGHDPTKLADAVRLSEETTAAQRAAAERARQTGLLAAGQRATATAAATRLEEGREQHSKLASLEEDARHFSRVADMLGDFRNNIVASVGPRLAVQAAELFAELTDREYDELRVDPATYQLQISDGGVVYGLDRFSGSEVDLANLALRVAISEHIHFQSGGAVGLLVLDEVFGPLDEDRKARMLLALERLRGRFRQVLVVTHDATIKDQLPNAIEVTKLPGRRARAAPALM